MHAHSVGKVIGMAIVLTVCHPVVQGEVAVKVAVSNQGPQVELRWPAQVAIPGANVSPDYELKRSFDLHDWENIPFTNESSNPAEILTHIASSPGSLEFYQVLARFDTALANAAPIDGADILGFSGVFGQELRQIGQISAAEFTATYPQPTNYLDRIDFDPTQAKYWDRVIGSEFQLTPAELEVFTNTGMVVSERLGGYSFADLFYRLYSSDLPVFISADAILQAWHKTFVGVLQRLEETYLAVELGRPLDGLGHALSALRSKTQASAPLRAAFTNSFNDADYFVTVARSLLDQSAYGSLFGQDARVAAALQAIQAEAYVERFDLFGAARTVDFSQFKPRGHYAASLSLQRYFRAMIWCGRIDLRVAGRTFGLEPEDTCRQLLTAIILNEALKTSGQYASWAGVDALLQTFVGHVDSMTFRQIQPILNAAGITSLTQITNAAVLTNLQTSILLGQAGTQDIRGDVYYSPITSEQIVLPRSFTFVGQRFVMDSWALSKVVFDSIFWDTNGVPEFQDKVQRRIPSALDVAFGVLGNNQVASDLVARIDNARGRGFRDGLPYQHNLAAVRNVIDQQNPMAWSDNIYVNWLAALRELSAPTTDASYPEAMRTRSWAMKNLSTQLASWTELRHDTVLYAKQSYTGMLLCDYPCGFVEPVPAFWQRLKYMAERTAALVQGLEMTGRVVVASPDWMEITDLAEVRTNLIEHFSTFAQTVGRLQTISEKELAQEPLTAVETDFLKDVMEDHANYTGIRRYGGWYPSLFYKPPGAVSYANYQGADAWDALVTDVHTDTPAPLVGDPGCVLHEAVGNVHLLMIAVDNGPDRMVFAGPVLSHYEFEMEGIQRKTDAEWKADIKAAKLPAHPEWTRGYLVPGSYTVPSAAQ